MLDQDDGSAGRSFVAEAGDGSAAAVVLLYLVNLNMLCAGELSTTSALMDAG